ncbi:hypothetical protein ACFL2Q_19555 [Thermodesulfobacteriota bacterium]
MPSHIMPGSHDGATAPINVTINPIEEIVFSVVEEASEGVGTDICNLHHVGEFIVHEGRKARHTLSTQSRISDEE